LKSTRRQFLGQIAAGTSALMLGCTAEGAAITSSRPNIVLIMADDMGYSDLGCYGGEIDTPNLDRLAAEGLRFTQFYNNGICVPTRASLLTGLYSQQVGVFGNSPKVYENCVTFGELLRSAGYRTLMVGKWHAQETPYKRGFDRHYGLCDGCCNFFNPGPRRPGQPEPGRKATSYGYPRRWAIDGQEYKPYAPHDPDYYTTDAFTDHALDYLDQYGHDEKPFVLYVAYTAPHYPLHARPEDIEKYHGKYRKGWDKLREERFERIKKLGLFDPELKLPSRDEIVPAWDDVDRKDHWDLTMAVYAGMIDRMDWNIGRILSKIDDLGKRDNTLILFLSDNGGCKEEVHSTPDIPPGPMESYRSLDPPWANASNTPFRKFKSWDHEGGICTPFIASWPQVIKQKGGVTSQCGHVMDVMATFVDVTGAVYPTEYKGREVLPLEGKSLLPVFQGKQRKGHEQLFWQIHPKRHRAVRAGKWKLVSPKAKEPWQLYDLDADRFETNDLAKEHPDIVADLERMYYQWAEKVKMPGRFK
jgi:arylsulfatase